MKLLTQTKPLYNNIKFASNFSAVQSIDELKALVDSLYSSDKVIGFDIETGYLGADFPKRALNMYNPNQFISGFSITNSPRWARYVSLKHDFANNLDPNKAWEIVKPLLEDKVGVAHNLLFEATNLRQLDNKGDGPRIAIPISKWHDSALQAYVLSDVTPMRINGDIYEGGYVSRYVPPFHRTEAGYQDPNKVSFTVGLKSLTGFRYNYNQNDIHSLFNGGKDLTQKQKDAIRFNTLPIEPTVVHYACDDAYLCLQLHLDQMEAINKDPYLPAVYSLEMQVMEVLADMNEVGVYIDWDGLNKGYEEFQRFEHNLKVSVKEKFEQETGRDQSTLNFNSPKQISNLVYGSKEEGGLGMEVTVRTDTNAPSTNDAALTSIRKLSPAVDSLLRYRQCLKMGDWFKLWTSLENQNFDNRLHPNFNQTRIQSGRFASSNPNCVQGDVEVLTPKGWVRFDELEDGVEVAQVSTDGDVSFVVPENVIRKQYSGNGVRIKSPGHHGWADLWMTPEHRVLSYTRSGMPVFESAQDWLRKWPGTKIVDRRIRRAGFIQGGEVLTDDELLDLEIAVAVQADGSSAGNHWYIKVRRDRKVSRLNELGLDPKYQESIDVHSSKINHSVTSRWLNPDKTFKQEVILGLSSKNLEDFMEMVMRWDGDSTRSCTFLQSQDRVNSVDLVQAVASLCGKSTTRYLASRTLQNGEEVKYPTVNVQRNSLRHVSRVNISEEEYEGTVYCVTVPTGAFMIRSNGTVLVTGNCQNVTKRWWFQSDSGSVSQIMSAGTPGVDYWTGNARDYITASPEYKILSFDYKSAEIQFLAALAQEHEIISAFRNGEDFHKWTASLVFGKPIQAVTKQERQAAKTISFASVYGSSIGSMAQQLGITKAEMEKIYNAYFARFPKLAKFFDDQHELVEKTNEVRTWLGRRAVIWESMHPDRKVTSKASRMAVNIPVQGGATGDYTKMAMVRASNRLKKEGLWMGKVRLLMNQHDSLVFEVHDSLDMDEIIEMLTPEVQFDLTGIKDVYCNFDSFPPMSVDWEVGLTWGSVCDYDKAYQLHAKELLVEISEGCPQSVFQSVQDVLTTNPGKVPVIVKMGETEIVSKFNVKAHPDVISKILNGDPDIGIPPHKSDFLRAEFRF